MIVVDASVLVDSLVGEGLAADRLVDEDLAAPHLVDAEVTAALRGLVLGADIDASAGRAGLADYGALEIDRHPHGPLLERVWALRNNLTAYDGLYIALAESLGVPLVTLDRRLATVPGIRATVELIPPGD